MNEYDLSSIIKKVKDRDDWCDTFLCRDNIAVGVLRLKPNEEDPQEPHTNDEIYYIIEGDGYLRIEDKDVAIKKDKVIFVPACAKHKFYGNSKELLALYVFAGEDKDISEK